ncbi:MAG: hypothetical protein RL748_1258, partial [Pseudomonadota bacterium]
MFVGLREKVLLFIISAMLIIGCVSLWMVNSIQKRTQLDLTQRAAGGFVQFHKERTLAAIQVDLALSRKMADSEALRQWVKHPEAFSRNPAARQELHSLLSLFSTRQAFIGSNPASSMYYLDQAALDAPELKKPQTLRRQDAGDQWFFRTLAQTEAWNFNLDHNAKLG